MRPSFRAKLMTIVGTTAIAFLVLIAASALVARRVDEKLTTIEERYVPKIELGPQLESRFERLQRGLQDAVAAHDAEALDRTRDIKDGLLARLEAAHRAVDAKDASALRAAVDDYYAAAYDVSRRLLSGETGEDLVAAMAAMQVKQARAVEALEKAVSFDRTELTEAFADASRAQATAGRIRLTVSLACLASVLLLSFWLSAGALRSLAALSAGFARFGKGEFEQPIAVASRDELGDVAQRANQMASSLQRLNAERDRADWLKSGHAGLARELRGELEPSEVATRAVRFIARYIEAPVAALYGCDSERTLRLLGHYAFSLAHSAEGVTPTFRLGEGLVGQAALQEEVTVIQDPPPEYLRVRSGLGDGAPRAVVLLPLLHSGRVVGVLELAAFKPWTEASTELLVSVRESVAIALEVAHARAASRELLARTQRQAERLAAQEDELRGTNEELVTQQEELRQTNDDLIRQTEELETQRRTLEAKNLELDEARRHLEQKAKELASVSAYKSQFLANMSHELRTPLNSMLLLSSLLGDNDGRNLTDKQVEFAKTIHAAGNDLLALINQVLDLAKVEAGKQEVRVEPVPLRRLADHAERVFGPLARDRGLAFVVEIAPDLPETIATDHQRIVQILNNLLGNAIKFTDRGQVALRILRPESDMRFRRNDLRAERTIVFVVSDTGVGIAPEHQERIFAPFEQVEAASDRRYGGTGLGLTIAREFTSLLGGELQLRSAPGTGSTFMCCLPFERPATARVARPSSFAMHAVTATPSLAGGTGAAAPPTPTPTGPAVDGEHDAYLLVIEDDRIFAETLGDVIRSQGLDFLAAVDGRTGMRLAKERKPSGIILDVKLPDLDGWSVMEALRADPTTATIPVHIISALDAAERGMAMGAVGYLTKPVTHRDLIGVVESLAPSRTERPCRILVVEDDADTGESLMWQLAREKLPAVRVASAREALERIGEQRFDCMILDLSLPDMDGLELLESLRGRCGSEIPPVVVYTGRALSKNEAKKLEAYAEAVVLKEGSSTERLLGEIRLFVRRLKEGLGPRRPVVPALHPGDVHLEGRKVLVVDDDMRTVYALSATLRAKGMDVLVADTGHGAISLLEERSDIELVLMDIMMPEMDGYEATRRIRHDARFRDLPIIALTAKAMMGDREKCIEAGASDYLSKPIDPERLLAMLHARLDGPPRHVV